MLETSDPLNKALAARAAAVSWGNCGNSTDFEDGLALPDRPARPSRPVLSEPGLVPKRKVGSARGRIALIHALAHIELNAIDLAFDMAARFAGECRTRFDDMTGEGGTEVTREFIHDWIGVGAEEAEHFELLEHRLRELGSYYGAMTAHDGLWQAAVDTKNNWAARLAVVPMVLEARGLDVTLAIVAGLRDNGDNKTAEILEKIYHDEIRHVQIGVKWFTRLCQVDTVKPDEAFKRLVGVYFKGQLKPPFNEKARLQAGLLPNFYKSAAQ